MPWSTWLCTKSTKSMLVKIVHPGGHVELHDSPFLAAELMLRNPRCCVAHPHIFKQPWAVVAPDTMLELGHKYYVVPVSTIRKLQRHSLKYSSPKSSVHEIDQSNNGTTTPSKEDEKIDDGIIPSICNWFFMNKNTTTKFPYACMTLYYNEENEKEGCVCEDNCFFMVTKNNSNNNKLGGDLKEETKSSSISSDITTSSSSEIETKALTRKRNRDSTRNIWVRGGIMSPSKRFASLDLHWQPSLESIHEE